MDELFDPELGPIRLERRLRQLEALHEAGLIDDSEMAQARSQYASAVAQAQDNERSLALELRWAGQRER